MTDRTISETSSVEGFVRPPKQTRSKETLDRIAQAALELMEEGGVEAATVGAIVARARSSIGSFYARFAGKDDLILFLQNQVWTDAQARWDVSLAEQDWDSLSLESVVEGVVALLFRSFRADFHQRRVLGRERREDSRGPRKVFQFHQHILATVTPLLLAHKSQILHPDPEWAIRLGYRFAVGGIREILEMEETAGVVDGAASAESLIPEVARAWLAYLGAAGAEQDQSETDPGVDFFDPWG
jgi:AcrR family transcriptional regulator